MVTKMRPSDLDQVTTRKHIESQTADVEYLRAHYSELLEKYRNQWIVVSEGKVIAAESNPNHLMKTLNKIQSKDVLVYFLADPEEDMLL